MQLKQALRTTHGFDAQMQLLSPATARPSSPVADALSATALDLTRDQHPMPQAKADPRDVNQIHKTTPHEYGDARDVNYMHKTAERGRTDGGSELPYRDRLQKSFGRHDLSGVKSHSGPAAHKAARAIGAEAYASGDDVVFGAAPDLHTAAHEAAHVIQQRQGISLSYGIGTHGDRFEQHADEVADRVVKGESAEALLDTMTGGAGQGAGRSAGVQQRAVQRKPDPEASGDNAREPAESEMCSDANTMSETATTSEAAATASATSASTTTESAVTTEAATPDADEAAPALPDAIGSGRALRAWITLFNKSLSDTRTKTRMARTIANLKAKGWGNDNGLDYDLLAAAAAQRFAASAPTGAGPGVPLPPEVINANILEMLVDDRVLLNVVTRVTPGRCLQFSAAMMKEMKVERADGSKSLHEKRSAGARKSNLTAKFRGEVLAAATAENKIPAGAQVCVVSRPDWGFTEVGNHWFVSAGGKYFLDDVVGVSTSETIIEALVGTTADQWAARVLDTPTSNTALRNAMRVKFTDELPQFKPYLELRPLEAQAQRRTVDPAEVAQARSAIKREVANAKRDVFRPKIWIIEPASDVAAEAGGEGGNP